MSDEKKIPGPPPDDFSKTTPNINLPGQASDSGDWDKTNYNTPRQPPAEEWGRTVANIKPIDTSGQDFDKTFYPGAQQKPSTPEWGMTEAKVDLGNADFGARPEAQEEGYGKTTPYFSLPEAERAKYQNLPPTPAEQAAQDQKDAKAKGGIPGWLWVSAGLMVMFFFAVVVLAVVYFFILGNKGFEAVVKGAPPGSEVRVDNSPVGVTSEDGSIRLLNLKAGEREISIVHPTFTCETRRVTGRDGINPEPIIARCQAVAAKATEDCGNFSPGEFDKAERCYNKALDDLPDPFTDEALVRALNILIINFDSGKYDVPPVRLAALQKGATFIKKLQQREPATILEVGGHTDSVGNDASNQTLSNNRANAVKDVLVRFGVNAAGLQTRGYGATKPKFDNNTEQGKFLNRRIEYSIVKR